MGRSAFRRPSFSALCVEIRASICQGRGGLAIEGMRRARKVCGTLRCVGVLAGAPRNLRDRARRDKWFLPVCSAKLRVDHGRDGMKGAQKPKKDAKKPAQKTLKEKRQEKRNAAKATGGLH